MTRRTSYLLAISLVAGLGPRYAQAQQTGRIVGRVTAAESGAPVSEVQVFVPGTGLGTLTRQNGAFVILEASQHLVHLVMHGHVKLLSTWSLVALSLLLFALLHVPSFRAASLALAKGVGRTIYGLFVDAPLWLVRRPIVKRIARSAPVVWFMRLLGRPAILTLPVWFAARAAGVPSRVGAAIAVGICTSEQNLPWNGALLGFLGLYQSASQ